MDTRHELEWGEFCHEHAREEEKFRTLLYYMARQHPTSEDNIDHLVGTAMKQFGRTGDFADTYRWLYSGADGLVAHSMPGYGAPRAVPNWDAYNRAAQRWDALAYTERRQVLEAMNAPEAVIEEEYYTLFINLPETLRWEIADHFELNPLPFDMTTTQCCSGSDSSPIVMPFEQRLLSHLKQPVTLDGMTNDGLRVWRDGDGQLWVETMAGSDSVRLVINAGGPPYALYEYVHALKNAEPPVRVLSLVADYTPTYPREAAQPQPPSETPMGEEYYGGDSSRLRQVDIYGAPLPQPSVTYILEVYDPVTGLQAEMLRYGTENEARDTFNARMATLPPGGTLAKYTQFMAPPVGRVDYYDTAMKLLLKLYGVVN